MYELQDMKIKERTYYRKESEPMLKIGSGIFPLKLLKLKSLGKPEKENKKWYSKNLNG